MCSFITGCCAGNRAGALLLVAGTDRGYWEMSFVLVGLALHEAAARFVAAGVGGPGLAGGVPNPAPKAPPGLRGPVDTVLAWGKWGVLVAGVAGLLVCGAKMAIGQRNRSSFAADGAAGVPWVLGGLSLAAVASAIVGVFLR